MTRSSPKARTTRTTPKARTRRVPPPPTAAKADPHALYQFAVQCPEAEVAFVDRAFKAIRGRSATIIREDFCGTAYTSCAWVRHRRRNFAIGLDLHRPTLEWGIAHNVAALPAEAKDRIVLLERDVLHPGNDLPRVDAVLAMNFSWWLFTTRDQLLAYFRAVRKSLRPDGVFFFDIYGGWEAAKLQTERRRQIGFTYVWDQVDFDPLTNIQTAHIHFDFRDGTRLRKAFTYRWRVWTIPEAREIALAAGFRDVQVYWEGDDDNGGGNGIFRRSTKGEACPSFIAYLSAAV